MRIDLVERRITLFLFAHQDDEFGAFQLILDALLAGDVLCAYLTDGGPDQALQRRRNAESRKVLQKLGVHHKDILFLGQELAIPDGRLLDRLDVVAHAIKQLAEARRIDTVYTPAWEGGHPDHDCLCAVATVLSEECGTIKVARQFPLYNGFRRVGPFFKVLSPLRENGPAAEKYISWLDRLAFIGHCLSYPSQWKTWMGLLPMVLAKYLISGVQSTQSLSKDRIHERPHPGVLYYERRGFATWQAVHGRLSDWQTAMDGIRTQCSSETRD